MEHPSLQPVKKATGESELRELIEKGIVSTNLEIPVKSLSLIDVDKVTETFKNNQSTLISAMQGFNMFLETLEKNKNIDNTELSRRLSEVNTLLEQVNTKFEQDFQTLIATLKINADKERIVLDKLDAELSK